MSALALALALAAVRPLPAPGDAQAGEAATQCIFYYRLQAPFVPGGDQACEAQGYGLDFMRAHWKDVLAAEARQQADLDAKLAEAHRRAAAMARRSELEGPCFAMFLDGGSGPDGGAALCELAGLTRGMVTRTARHRAFLADQAAAVRRRKLAVVGGLVLAGLVALGALARRRRRHRAGR